MSQHLTIGSRGSALALTQSQTVRDLLLGAHPNLQVRIEVIRTTGDATSGSLRDLGGAGLFTKEIETSLLNRRVDLAVHSLKDLPTEQHPDLELTAVPAREDVRDVLIAGRSLPELRTIDDLPEKALIGTGSRRRQAQLLALRPDLRFVEIRGNLDTRIGRASAGECDAVVLAAAGMHRLGWRDRIGAYIAPEQLLPAPGQAALGLQMRRDEPLRSLLGAVDDPTAHAAVRAERSLLRTLGGGCQAPIAAWGRLREGELLLDGLVGNEAGTRILRLQEIGPLERGEELGEQLGQRLLAGGAVSLLGEVS